MKRTVEDSHRTANRAFAAASLVLFGVGWFSTAQEANIPRAGRSSYAAIADAPEKARARKNPFEGDVESATAGGKLFEQHCSDCHGRKAGGTRRGPSLLREEVQQATPGTVFWILTNGVVRKGMPVWSKLPEPERWQIVTFLQSLKPSAASISPNSPQSP